MCLILINNFDGTTNSLSFKIQCSVEIINYGPIVSKLHFAKGTNIPTWLSLKLCGKLNPGEKGKLEVSFAPTSTDFTELEQNVETSFNIEVIFETDLHLNNLFDGLLLELY